MRAHLALCSRGMLGLITSEGPQATPYSGDYQDLAWVGIQMSDAHPTRKIGDRWMSKCPRVLCALGDSMAGTLIRRFNLDTRWMTYPGDHMRVRGHVANERLMLVESMDGDRYEHEDGKWSQTAGTAACPPSQAFIAKQA
jgi:hypothetical protein